MSLWKQQRPEAQCIACFRKSDMRAFWTDHWLSQVEALGKPPPQRKSIPNRYLRFCLSLPGRLGLSREDRILEAGCGMAAIVQLIDKAGFTVTGIDTSDPTLDAVRARFPNLDLLCQDVYATKFPDSTFRLIYSLGVIEHREVDWDVLLDEKWRLLQPGGFLAISFPALNLIRRIKMRLNLFEADRPRDPAFEFYQYLLSTGEVRRALEHHGFRVLRLHRFDALKGMKDEFAVGRAFLQRRYDTPITSNAGYWSRWMFEQLFCPLTHHMSLFVAQKAG